MTSMGYLFGPPPPAPATFPSRSNSASDIISTQIPTDLISKILNESLATGEVTIDNVELTLDSITGSNTTVENLKVDTITKNLSDYIRTISDIRFESNTLFGSNGNAIDSDYKVKILGNFMVSGTNIVLDNDNITMKDNCIGIGVSNSNIDNFINGYYFPKNDNFSGFGLSVDKVGVLSLPYGEFESLSKFNYQNSDLKRFSDSRNSFRFVYISSNYNINSSKTLDNPFTTDERGYINSLNNKSNQISNYYVNAEMNNIVCHGGYFISGISQNFNIVLTKGTNTEDVYISCNLDNERIEFLKNISLNLSSHSITNNGTINFTTQATSPSKFFTLANSENKTYRNLYFNNNGSGNSNIIFGGEDTQEQNTFTIYYNNTTKPIISIDSTTTATNKVEMKTRLVVEGPNTVNYPSLKIINNMSGNKIGSIPPISNNYLQAVTITASTTTNFTLVDILASGYTDLIFTGQLILSDTTNNKHLAIRLEGFYSTITSSVVTTRTILSKKNINLTESTLTTDIMITPSISGTTLIVAILNNLTSSLKGVLRLEIIEN